MEMNCRKCGKCCSNLLPLCMDDINKIKNLKNSLKENKLLLDKNWYMRCPFLNYKNECDIYENRPLICKEYDCKKFETATYTKEMLNLVQTKGFELINMREYFFGGRRR